MGARGDPPPPLWVASSDRRPGRSLVSLRMPALSSSSSHDVPADGAAEAVQALRDAICDGHVEAVQNLRWLAPRPPGERDLFSDMAAAEGLNSAVSRLARFWRRADVRLERVRPIDGLEAEVYERLNLPGESLPIVTVVRRPSPEAPWRVVCTNEAYDERFVLWIAEHAERINDVAWTRRFTQRFAHGGDLLMDGDSGVLGHPEQYDWLVNVRGPFAPRSWPETLPGEGGRVVELVAALTPDAASRHAQLMWLLESAEVFLDALDGVAAYFPVHKKLVVPQALAAAASGALTASQSLRFWSRLEENGEHVYTVGLRQVGVPEIEARLDLLETPDATRRLVRWTGASLLGNEGTPTVGTELVIGEESVLVVGGRRGPRRGRSYGRWGAIALVRSDPSLSRGSRARMRVPDDF